MEYDVIVIGAGLSGLTAASLLSKRGFQVGVIDQAYQPGGSCGIFKRNHVTFDQGSAMLYGFGEAGFNSHRFVFNCLEEPIDMIKHDVLYAVNFEGKRIRFWPDVAQFVEELSQVFPGEKESIRRFYSDMQKLYEDVMVGNQTYNTADETDPKNALKSLLKHPWSYIKFLSYLNMSAKSLLQNYFKDPTIFNFFDKMTSTYCYATVEEAPAVMAAVMFIDNHVGGSYYPAGSTLFLPGKLEKVIEEHGGEMLLEEEVEELIFHAGEPVGVRLLGGKEIYAKDIVYSGNVWQLYERLIPQKYSTRKQRMWAKTQEPTYPSVVLYGVVEKDIIPESSAAIEMLVGNPKELDESEVTVYLFSLGDRTLCAEDEHTVVAIGPSFVDWNALDREEYLKQKEAEIDRLKDVLDRRYPGIKHHFRYAELATPRTLERYNRKYRGAVAGPKQMIGQHMFRRLKTRTQFKNLFCCGESTVMGTGTPTVTVSGISAANAILKKYNHEPFVYEDDRPDMIRMLPSPVTRDNLYSDYSEEERRVMHQAMRCRFCEFPTCAPRKNVDVGGVMRRVAVGNFRGAVKRWNEGTFADDLSFRDYENSCIYKREGEEPVAIRDVVNFLEGWQP